MSGGFVPVGAVALRKNVFDAVSSSRVRARVHGSTFSKNNLAMAAELATLRVIRQENLVGNAARLAESHLDRFRALTEEFEFLHSVREVLAATHEVPGCVWDLGKPLASQALRNRADRT